MYVWTRAPAQLQSQNLRSSPVEHGHIEVPGLSQFALIPGGAISHFLSIDTPGEVVSDRMNVSKDVIDDDYDSRSEREKMELRRKYLNNI